ncbi:MAG: ribonuclease HII [Candidatus Thorarchaeota archaeon]|nr:ribonuclease HII [Candidatus Thorarchaeota archaeon]
MSPLPPESWRIAGVDEAGRGPMIGPLVVCGVLADPEGILRLKEIGVRDSKSLTPRRRSALCEAIREIAIDVSVQTVSAADIDRLRTQGVTLNVIEVRAFALALRTMKPSSAILDAADVNPERFGRMVLEHAGIQPEDCTLISCHKADSTYPVVSAASIVAKVERDSAVQLLHREYGDFGSGYPSDPKSIAFVRGFLERHEELPDIVRKTWRSSRLSE